MGPGSERLGVLTIANGATDSNIIAERSLASARQLIIYTPAVLPETVTLQFGALEDVAAGDMRDVRVNGSAPLTLRANSAEIVDAPGARAVRAVAGAAVAAERVFTVHVVF
jgi:hypothetical protein